MNPTYEALVSDRLTTIRRDAARAHERRWVRRRLRRRQTTTAR